MGKAEHGADHGAKMFTVTGYVTGFFLSVILTVIPFWLTMNHVLSPVTAVAAIMVLAFVQVLVQVGSFLHLDSSPEQRPNVMSFAFTALIAFFVISGSVVVIKSVLFNLSP